MPTVHTTTAPALLEQSPEQALLQIQLSRAVRRCLSAVREMEQAVEDSRAGYRAVAEVLVALRHTCTGPRGEPHDLLGRSAVYRALVRSAYLQAGADPDKPIAKRLTAGVAYWVKKLLLDQYGEAKLAEMGIVPRHRSRSGSRDLRAIEHLPQDPQDCLAAIVGILNRLASDPTLVPTEETVRAAARAVSLLQSKLTSTRKTSAA